MRFLIKPLLAGIVSTLAAAPVSAAALKLNVLIDGKPVVADVLVDGEKLGATNADGSFWHDGLTAGQHFIDLEVAGKKIPYKFSLEESEAALITLAGSSNNDETKAQIERVPLASLDVLNSDSGIDITFKDGDKVLQGVIQGHVQSLESSSPIRNAKITVIGRNEVVRSDRNGEFHIELPQGAYSLRIEHQDFRSSYVNEVNVLSKMDVALTVELPQKSEYDDGIIEEVVVTASYSPNNPIALERMSSSVLDSMDFSQISRFGDSTVSSALKRIVGVSLENDRYAVVRGMKSRYQSAYFNGAILPSTDPSRRDLPLDIFPASIMQGLSLQKSATADVPGNATAGHLEMRTREIPDEPFFKISASYGYGDAHSKDALMVKGGGKDWLGKDDGTRNMPSEAAALQNFYFDPTNSTSQEGEAGYTELSGEQLEALGESFRQDAIYKGTAKGDTSLDMSGGRSWEFGEEQRIGIIGAARYSNEWTNNQKIEYNFSAYNDEEEGRIVRLSNATVTDDTNNIIDLSAMLNLQWDLSVNHSLGFNNILLRHTTNSAEIETVYDPKFNSHESGIPSSHPSQWPLYERARAYRIDWIEEQLISRQVWGQHYFPLPLADTAFAILGTPKLDWQFTKSVAKYDRPDAQKYTYTGLTPIVPEFRAGRTTNYSTWETSDEDAKHHTVDLELPINEVGDISSLVKVGVSGLKRERLGDRYSWAFDGGDGVSPEILENPDPDQVLTPDTIGTGEDRKQFYVIAGGILPEDDVGWAGNIYISELTNDAKYLQTETNFYQTLKASIGVRKEQFSIAAEQYAYTAEPLRKLVDEDRTLPSFGLTWMLNDAWQLRSAYSKTVGWPEIFEVVPRTFRDIETLKSTQGNPNLKPADIKNYDMRLEWYPSDNESVTLGLFYKDISNAIEDSFSKSGETFDYYTYENVESADVKGWELDTRQEFSLSDSFNHQMFVQFNYARIFSAVNLPNDAQEFDPDRPLQGQPKYIMNIQLGYDHIPSNQEITLVFNRKGQELAVVSPATGSNPGNVYTTPYNDLKLIYRKHVGELVIGLSAENLLDSEKLQEFEEDKVPYLSYKPGREYKMNVSYQF